MSHSWLQSALNVILPQCCMSCGIASEHTFCLDCQATWKVNQPACSRCAEPQRDQPACHAYGDRGWPYIRQVHCSYIYQQEIQRLLNQIKINHDAVAMRALARHWVQHLHNLVQLGQLNPQLLQIFHSQQRCQLSYIPRSKRGMQPGPHLATILARALQRRWPQFELLPLHWERPVAVQHRLSWSQRQRNVQGQLRCPAQLKDKSVLLVDDIVTSGATLRAAAASLHHAGANDICCLALARTPR